MNQEKRYSLSMAGEYAVASELNRRELFASITYGTSKSADIFVVSKEIKKLARIEVKSTDKKRWLLGSKIADQNKSPKNHFWVLVQLPMPLNISFDDDEKRGENSPRFYVLTANEIYKVWKKGVDEYNKRRRRKNKGKFPGLGVPAVNLDDVEKFEGQWNKILNNFKKDF